MSSLCYDAFSIVVDYNRFVAQDCTFTIIELRHCGSLSLCISQLRFFLAPPRNTPQLTKIEELYGESHVDFNCTGNPGYPDGELKFEVMLSNDTEFRPFQFYSSKVTNEDRKCVRSQLVNTTFLFNVEWNQAKIRCTNGPNYDETNIYIIPRKYIT